MMKSKKSMSWSFVLTAVLVVALILVIFFVVVLPIAKNGVTFKDIQQNIKEGKIFEMFSKNPTASNIFAGEVYTCDPQKKYKIFVDGNPFYITLVKCDENSVVIDLYDLNKQSLNEQITVEKETTGCFVKSKICIKLFSIDTSGKTPVVTLSAKAISESFEVFALSTENTPPGPVKTFWCEDKQFKVILEKYWNGGANKNDAFLRLYMMTDSGFQELTNSGQISTGSGLTPISPEGNIGPCIDRTQFNLESGWDAKENAIRCTDTKDLDKDSFTCGEYKITCGDFNRDEGIIKIIDCSKTK